MGYYTEVLNLLAKSLSMLANGRVVTLAEAISGTPNYPPEVTGAVLELMPHIFEKAIITSPAISADVAVSVSERFVNEFESSVKAFSNAAEFSNPIKKAIFNATFHSVFRREYDDLKPKINKLWEAAREEGSDPVEFLAYAVYKRAESLGGISANSEVGLVATTEAVNALFSEIHDDIRKSLTSKPA
jgi:hypothetical protein